MTDEIRTRDEPESPCVKICVIDPEAALCMGCLRTAEEISRWGTMSPQERRMIMKALPARAPLLKKTRRGGRKGRKERMARMGGSGES